MQSAHKSKIVKYDKNMDYSYTLGVFPTIELVKNRPESVIKLIFSTKSDENKGIHELKALCKNTGIPFEYNDRALGIISSKENVYAVGVFTKYESDLNWIDNHLVLVNPSDMGNLGTIIRTMVGFGVKELVVIRPAADVFDPKTIRASMGALFQVNVKYFESFEEYQSRCSNTIYPFMTNASQSAVGVSFNEPYSLVFGSESAGLEDSFLKIGNPVFIPQSKDIDSLNLSISVGIGLFTAVR